MFLLGRAMTAARALRAQQKAIPVGRLSPRCLARPVSPYLDAFRRRLSETGYVEGQNLAIEYPGRRATQIDCPHWRR
jgi:putative ABC transport system substrate-binding protein